MDAETYIKRCCEAWVENPPCWEVEDREQLRWLVRYYAHNIGAGLDIFPIEEVNKHLWMIWDAYVKGFFGTRYMKMMGNFSNKQLFSWVLEARDRELRRRNGEAANARSL